MNQKHIFFYKLFRPLVIVFLKIVFGYRYQKADGLPDNYIVISNHVTDYDPLFVCTSFPKQMYFVGSEHIARWKKGYQLLNYAFAPIMRYKGATAASAIAEMLRKIKKGANVCLFAEGVRTWDGVTCSIPSATGKLVKTAGCGLVTYKITGGYFVSPMWGGASRRCGPISGHPVSILTKEQLREMSNDEINAIISRDLYEDAYERQMKSPQKYKGKNPAEHIEKLLFLCPECGKMDAFSSHEDKVKCKYCDLQFRYNEYGILENAPFDNLRDFSNWQKEKVMEDVASRKEYRTDKAALYSIRNHQEEFLIEGELVLSTEELRLGEYHFPLKEIVDMAMHGQQALVFTANREYYEILPKGESNTLKFLLYYEEYKKQYKR